LHALDMPPAFILSQDQTLIYRCNCFLYKLTTTTLVKEFKGPAFA
jgi:hypothetical protein